MSALLATHTAIRVARDVGYPHIDPTPPPQPAIPIEDPLDYFRDPPPRPLSQTIAQGFFNTLVVIAIVLAIITLIFVLNNTLD